MSQTKQKSSQTSRRVTVIIRQFFTFAILRLPASNAETFPINEF